MLVLQLKSSLYALWKCVVCFSCKSWIFVLLLTKHRKNSPFEIALLQKYPWGNGRSLWFIFHIASKWPSYICGKDSLGAVEPWKHIHLGHWVPHWFLPSIGCSAGKKKKRGGLCFVVLLSATWHEEWGQEMRAWERPRERAGNTPASLSQNTHAYKYLCTLQSPDFSNKAITAVEVFT